MFLRRVCLIVICLAGLLAAGCGRGLAQVEGKVLHKRQTAPPRAADAAASWPCWRGAGSRGIAAGARLPESWPKSKPEPQWEQRLGGGWSSPIVAARRVFVTDRKGNEERLVAFDAASGQPLWEVKNRVSFDPHAVGKRHGNGPKSTPATENQRVYSLGIAGWLQCVDVEKGTVIWKHNLPAEVATQVPLRGDEAVVNGTENVLVPTSRGMAGAVPLFGYTGSLLLMDGRLILSVGGERGGTIMAFDAASGQVLWKALDEHVSYSSPVPAEVGGSKQVVVMTGPRVVGLRADSGELLWSHPFQIQYDESISTPAIADGMVLVTGDSHPLTALRIAADGDGLTCAVAWENLDLSSYLSSMLVHEGYVYGMADDGRFACVRLADGKTMWQGGDHGYYCSPILAGSRLLGLNDEGSLLVLEASPRGYLELWRSQVASSPTWTMPAVVGSRIYIRSGDGLACYDFAAEGS